jgi:hypothetical protein
MATYHCLRRKNNDEEKGGAPEHSVQVICSIGNILVSEERTPEEAEKSARNMLMHSSSPKLIKSEENVGLQTSPARSRPSSGLFAIPSGQLTELMASPELLSLGGNPLSDLNSNFVQRF